MNPPPATPNPEETQESNGSPAVSPGEVRVGVGHAT